MAQAAKDDLHEEHVKTLEEEIALYYQRFEAEKVKAAQPTDQVVDEKCKKCRNVAEDSQVLVKTYKFDHSLMPDIMDDQMSAGSTGE